MQTWEPRRFQAAGNILSKLIFGRLSVLLKMGCCKHRHLPFWFRGFVPHRTIHVLALDRQEATGDKTNDLPIVLRIPDLAFRARRFHVLGDCSGRLEHFQALWTAVVNASVSRAVEMGHEARTHEIKFPTQG